MIGGLNRRSWEHLTKIRNNTNKSVKKERKEKDDWWHYDMGMNPTVHDLAYSPSSFCCKLGTPSLGIKLNTDELHKSRVKSCHEKYSIEGSSLPSM